MASLYAEENQLLFMETSAKTGTHVTEAFTLIGKMAVPRTTRFLFLLFFHAAWYSIWIGWMTIAKKLPKVEPPKPHRSDMNIDIGSTGASRKTAGCCWDGATCTAMASRTTGLYAIILANSIYLPLSSQTARLVCDDTGPQHEAPWRLWK